MNYATVRDLQERARLDELAEAASSDPDVDGDLLGLALKDKGDLSVYTPAQREAVNAAIARLEAAVADAGATVRSHLAARYGDDALAGDEVARVLRARTLDLAEYALLGGASDSDRHARYSAAGRWLRGVAEGRLALPVQAGAPAQQASAEALVAPAGLTGV